MAIDGVAKHELELFIVNEGRLYNQRQSIEANIARKMLSGKYDHKLAPKLWMYWVDAGAKLYCKMFGGEVRYVFPKPLRESLAKDFANVFGAEVAREIGGADAIARSAAKTKKKRARRATKEKLLPAGHRDLGRLPQPWLNDYRTGERIRRATSAEATASRKAAGPFGGPGVILVRGRSVFVDP